MIINHPEFEFFLSQFQALPDYTKEAVRMSGELEFKISGAQKIGKMDIELVLFGLYKRYHRSWEAIIRHGLAIVD